MTDEVNQITLFDSDETSEVDSPHKLNDWVQVVIPPLKSLEIDSESYYYLKDFENKIGSILKVVKIPTLQYHVDISGKIAIVYHDELVCGQTI